MARGQAEHLMPMITHMLADQDMTWSDLDLIAVGTGPGNFTGIRISVAAARGLSLGLGIPAFGISAFEVMRRVSGRADIPDLWVSVPGPKDSAYCQRFKNGTPAQLPIHLTPTDTDTASIEASDGIVGHRADWIARTYQFPDDAEVQTRSDMPDAPGVRIAQIALERWRAGEINPPRPAPLYVRPADAAPARDKPPVLLD